MPAGAFRGEPAFDPATDWPAVATMALGVAAVGMMFLDWSTSKILNREASDNGFDRDLMPAAPIILVILLIAMVAIAGWTIIVRRPKLLAFAAIPAFAALMVVIVMMTTLNKIGGDILSAIPGGSYSLGEGAWLCLVFTIFALGVCLVPLAQALKQAAEPAEPPRPPEFPHAEGD